MRELTAATGTGQFVPPDTDDSRLESFGAPACGSQRVKAEWLAPWRAFWRHKHLLIVGAALGALLGVLCSIPQTPIYEAGALIEVRGFNENFLNLSELNPTDNGASQQAADADTAVRTMTSRSLLARVVDKLNLDSRREFVVASRLAAWRGALGLPESDTRPPRVRAIELAARHLSVSTVGKAKLVAVRCESVDPALATAFVNTLIEEFVAQSADSRWQANRRTEEWLGRQLDELRVKLESSEQALQDYARSNGLLITGDRDSVAEEKLRQLQTTLLEARAGRIERQSRWNLASSSAAESLPEILDSGPLKEYQVKLTDLRREFAEYNSTYTPAHYKVKRVKAQIDELESTIRAERTHVLERIRNEYESAVLRERMIETDYASQSGLVTAQAGKSVEYRILEREAATNRALYDNLLQKVKEAGVAAAMAASNVRVIDAAATPTRPIRPDHALNGGLGLASGAVLGLLLIFIRERTDRTLREPGDAALFLGLPELGVIPDGDGESGGLKRVERPPARGEILRIGGTAGGADPDRRHDDGGVELATWRRRPSLIAECFRATLTSILFTGGANQRPRVLVVTSASPGEGKTTVASNLAIALAEINRRVLLIDADMRKPRLHQVFGVSNRSGLSNLLRERTPSNGTPLAGLVQATGIPELFVLSSGPGAPSIPNLLHSERMAELLAKARAEFDTILIDSPPMLPIADARILARSADAVVLVVQAGRTSRDSARTVVSRFLEDGSVVLGVVLNSWTPAGREYGDYYEYTAYARAS